MREVKPVRQVHETVEGRPCPGCGGRLVRSLVPCPEGKPGCIVAHYGYRCLDCARCWRD